MSHSGARQWRHYCECLEGSRSPGSSKEHRMHSEVSIANASYFISEDRLARDDLDADDLEAMVRDTDGSLIVCNSCGELKVVGVTDDSADSETSEYVDSWGLGS